VKIAILAREQHSFQRYAIVWVTEEFSWSYQWNYRK
jgi:predicted metal-dependent HD superfamily phosphohydrolase